MSTTRSPLYERDLALPVKDYLRAEGWEVFEEVGYRGKIADIVATRGEDVAVFELKKRLGFPVVVQAKHWLAHAHFSWVVVPMQQGAADTAKATWELGVEVCRERGIGLIAVRALSKLEEERLARGVEPVESRLDFVHEAEPQPTFPFALRAALAPEHQSGAYAGAGTKTGVRWNATQAAYQRIRDYLTECGGAALLDVVLRETSAPAFVRDHIARAVVERVRLNGTEISGGVMLELVAAGEEAPLYSPRNLRTRRRA